MHSKHYERMSDCRMRVTARPRKRNGTAWREDGQGGRTSGVSSSKVDTRTIEDDTTHHDP